jgi:hypothetical protein
MLSGAADHDLNWHQFANALGDASVRDPREGEVFKRRADAGLGP